MDKLAAVRCFVEVVDQGSLTAASETLGRSLPTVVRTLSSLEESLGVVLLRRTTRRMSLTEEGRICLERSRQLLADFEEMEALVRSGLTEPRGTLRVTAPVLFGQMHIAPAVRAFVQRYASVEVDMLLLDRIVNLVDEGIDVGVRIDTLEDSSLIAIAVGQVRRVVCATPAFIKKFGNPKSPGELRALPCVRFTGAVPVDTWRFNEGGRERAIPVRGSIISNHGAPAIDACLAGLGFGRFLSYQVEDAVRDGRLQVVLRDFEPPPIPINLVYPGARLMSSKLRTFLDWMKQHLQAHVPTHES